MIITEKEKEAIYLPTTVENFKRTASAGCSFIIKLIDIIHYNQSIQLTLDLECCSASISCF